MRIKPGGVRATAWILFAVGLCSSAPHALAQVQYQTNRYVNLRPREESGKTDLLFKASRWYLIAGTSLDGVTTAMVLDHPPIARQGTDGKFLGRYRGTETGWASFVGDRSASKVVLANALLNLAVDWSARRLYRRGGKWKYLAIGLNLCKGTASFVGGVHNVRVNADANGVVRRTTGYTGRIVWSSR